MRLWALRTGWVALWGVAFVIGCEAPPAQPRGPQTQPAENPPQTATQPVGGAASQPTAGGDTASSVRPPRPAEPELPEYVTLLERIDPDQPVTLQVRTAGRRRLVIDTRNVRRLRIDRERLPLDRRGSIVLTCDGQGIEWLASSEVEEFERSATGDWRPVPATRR